ncbi:unnamed protein product, partial [Medioppia subpectinata]
MGRIIQNNNVGRTKSVPKRLLDELRDRHSNLHVLQLDGTDYKSFDGFAKQVADIVGDRGLDTLILSAGICIWHRLDEVTAEDMVTNFEVNAVSRLMLSKALLPVLKLSAATKRKTTIVNIGALLGSIEFIHNLPHRILYPYVVSKTAINMISKCLDVDLAPHGIRSVVIHPGHVATDMGGEPTEYVEQFTVQKSVAQVLRTAQNVKESDY